MKRLIFSFLIILFPTLVLATTFQNPTGITFTPPPGDVSVVFLGNLFGVVDGVLHGTGSQILGNLFSVFNSAVLAIGGLVLTYTMLVSTVNTANEGKMLGQKWSSVWVPTRATLGLALLIPKASGYCLMQVFVMWVVVQGVGAADKVWSSALSYISRGGAIVQPQVNPITNSALPGIVSKNSSAVIPTGAATILAGQVCMYGLQTGLETIRTLYLNAKQNDSGPCFVLKNDFESPMGKFCNNPVPDFLSTVSPLSYQSANSTATSFNLKMPNFDDSEYFSSLNGICGVISWKAFSTSKITVSLSDSEKQTIQMSRAVALQQLYSDLTIIAQIMVNNDPQLQMPVSSNSIILIPRPAWATQQYGVPFSTADNSVCDKSSSNCQSWGALTENTTSPLFTGSEFQNAIADYSGIMMPSLNILNTDTQDTIKKAQTDFINQANSQGWMMAGSYFIQLALLNSSYIDNSAPVDSDSGLDKSATVDLDTFLGVIPTNGNCQSSSHPDLCTWLNNDSSLLNNVVSLINGRNPPTFSGLGMPSFTQPINTITGQNASTTYGYINNSAVLNLGQPGMTPPSFNMNIIPNFTPTNLSLPPISFSCSKVKIPGFVFCLGEYLGQIFYEILIKSLFVFFLNMIVALVNAAVMAFLILPLQGMVMIFQSGVAFLQQPAMNPVLALANMGINFINFASELWIYLILIAMIPGIGLFLMPMIALAMPLLVAWLGTMFALGFVTAYYVPFLPYMIFTFGSIGWLMAVVEAMVAAPIVALGVTHPEGEGPFGKSENAIMILMNVFLRPAMMIIGYITAIALSYVAVWVINAGFANVVSYLQDPNSGNTNWHLNLSGNNVMSGGVNNFKPNSTLGYSGWAGIYAYFFSILIYTSMYLTVVQKAFTLIVVLPDKVLRWIGGQQESAGQETAQWSEDAKGKVESGAKATTGAAQQMDKQMSGFAMDKIKKVQGPGAGASASGGLQSAGDTTPKTPDT